MIFDLSNATQYSCSPPFSKGGSSLDQCCEFGTEILKGKKKICMNNLSLNHHSPLAIDPVLGVDSAARVHDTFHIVYGSTENGKRAKAWSDNNINDGWEDVIYPLWVDSKYGLKTRGGEFISMDGLMGLCFNKCSSQHLRAEIDRVVLQYLGASSSLVVTNSPAFGTFYQTCVNDNNILCPIPGDFSLLPNSFECCPEWLVIPFTCGMR